MGTLWKIGKGMKQRHKLYFYHLLTQWWPDSKLLQPIKRMLLRWCGLKIGRGAWIASNVIIRGDGRIEIGENAFIMQEVIMDCYGGFRLGETFLLLKARI